MTFLLDTHVWLWLMTEPERLPRSVRNALRERDTDVWISAVSIWETAIKLNLGKLTMPNSLAYYLALSTRELALRVLDIKSSHALAVGELALHRRDPFDRMLIAQATHEQFSLVTADAVLYSYPADLLWAGPGRAPTRRHRLGGVGARRRDSSKSRA